MTTTGELNKRVRFERQAQQSSQYGGGATEWVECFSRAAAIKPIMGRASSAEPVMAQRLNGVQPVLIIVRYDSETSTIDTSMRAVEVLNGVTVRYFALKTVEDMEQKRAFITMLAESGDADGGDGR